MKVLVKKNVVLNNEIHQPGVIVEVVQEWMPSDETLAMLLADGVIELTDKDLTDAAPVAVEPAAEPAAAEGDAPLGEAGQEQPAASEATSSEQLPEQSADAPKSVAKTVKVDIKK